MTARRCGSPRKIGRGSRRKAAVRIGASGSRGKWSRGRTACAAPAISTRLRSRTPCSSARMASRSTPSRASSMMSSSASPMSFAARTMSRTRRFRLEIFAALDASAPAFAHHNLLTTASGEGLSKRLGHLSLRGLREAGIEPMAVASLAVLTGTSEALRPMASMEELAEHFSLDKVSRASAKFDEHEIAGLNGRLLHKTPYATVADRLLAQGIGGGEAFWLAVRGNCERLEDAAQWWRVVAAADATCDRGERPRLPGAKPSPSFRARTMTRRAGAIGHPPSRTEPAARGAPCSCPCGAP